MQEYNNNMTARPHRERGSAAALTASVIAVILVVNVILYILAITLGLYIVPKDGYKIELSGATDSLFADAIAEKRKVKITFCYPEADVKNHETGAPVYKTATDLKERYPDFIELDFVNIITKRNDKGELVSLSKYQTDMRGNETNIRKSSVIFECGRNYMVITDNYSTSGFSNFYTTDAEGYTTSYNGEEIMAAMISWVLHDEHKTAYLTMAHSEQADSAFANLLSAAGYYLDVINLRDTEILPSDENIGLVVISNPQSDFEKAAEGSGVRTEIEWLKSYVNDNGGSLYVSLDPYVRRLPVLEGFLAEYGLEFSVTESDGTSLRNIVKDPENAITTDGFTLVASHAEGEVSDAIAKKVAEYDDGRVILREASALKLSGSAQPLLVSSSTSVCETGGRVTATGGGFTVAAYSEGAPNFEGERGKIMLIPSIYATVSDALVTNGYSNKEFVFAAFEELYGAKGIPYGCEPVLYESTTLENLTMGTARIYTALILAVPAALAVTCGVITVRRKNR